MLEAASAQPPTSIGMTVHSRRAAHAGSFHELLSEMNPLQYIPIVGTIYRSATGDTIPEAARTVGSLVFSGLTGGPIGVAISLAALAVEKILDIDPEKIGAGVLSDIGIGQKPSPPAQIATPWPAAAFKTAGVSVTNDGNLQRGSIVGCDVLNEMELERLQKA